MTNGIYSGVLGLDSLAAAAEPAPVVRGSGRRCRALTSSSSGWGWRA